MSAALVDHCLELLSPIGTPRAKRMFGGYGLYVDELFVALIAFDKLYLKVDAQNRPQFEAAGCSPFVYDGKAKPVTMSYWTVPAEAMESPALMQPWARSAMAAALRAKAAKPAAAPRKAAAKTGRNKPIRAPR
jgi:DNA transformation protein and related proteins